MSALRLLAVAALALLAGAAPAAAQVTQPEQPQHGPGGSDYSHADYRVTAGGSGADAWYVFEPTSPRPTSAPVAVITHGYFEFSGYQSQLGLIEHTVRKGSVVIFTRWQTTPTYPCPGPFDIEPCIQSEVNGIKGALAFLRDDAERVQPDVGRTSYFGHSFGGIITANVASRWRALGLPKPRAVFLDDPHDGGFTGPREPALDADLSGIPATTRVVCHSGAHGVLDDAYTGAGDLQELGRPKQDGSCNAVFGRLTSVPRENKSLVLTSEDAHGAPALTSDHGVCAGPIDVPGFFTAVVDAYDWGFCWRTWDALRSCALQDMLCRYAVGDTPQNRYIGTWSDGTPIVGLKIQDTAPVRAQPVPARAAKPPANTPATVRVTRTGRRVLRGRAADDDAVLRVRVAVARRGTPKRFRTARGTTSWSVRLPSRLRPGGYRLSILATDSDGIVTRVNHRLQIR